MPSLSHYFTRARTTNTLRPKLQIKIKIMHCSLPSACYYPETYTNAQDLESWGWATQCEVVLAFTSAWALPNSGNCPEASSAGTYTTNTSPSIQVDGEYPSNPHHTNPHTRQKHNPTRKFATAERINPAIQKHRMWNFFQTVNHSKVIWCSQAKPQGLLGGHLNI